MALIKCKECGNEISTEAKTCPNCGAKPTKQYGCGAILILIIVFMILIKACDGDKSSSNTVPSKTAERSAAEKKKNDQTIRAIAGASTLKKAMRNPDSFKLESALLMNDGSVCYKIRSQNGFGGMNKMKAVLYGGDSIKTSEMEGFSSKWNKYCANKSGEDATDYIEMAIK